MRLEERRLIGSKGRWDRWMNRSALAPLKRTQMAERGAVFELSAITGLAVTSSRCAHESLMR